jgi:hypothetical protein
VSPRRDAIHAIGFTDGCSDCGTTENAAPRSYDMDLLTIVLCDMCAVLVVSDYRADIRQWSFREHHVGLAGRWFTLL